MMNAFDDPIDFSKKRTVNAIDFEYVARHEVVQGGPRVGKLKINDRTVSESDLFGGPFLVEQAFVYVPILTRRFLGFGFKLCRIDVSKMDYHIVGPVRDIIFLDRIEGNQILFYEDLDKTRLKYYDKREFDRMPKGELDPKRD